LNWLNFDLSIKAQTHRFRIGISNPRQP